MSDDRFSMNTFDGLLGTTEDVVEKMINGDISPREADIVLKAVSGQCLKLRTKQPQVSKRIQRLHRLFH